MAGLARPKHRSATIAGRTNGERNTVSKVAVKDQTRVLEDCFEDVALHLWGRWSQSLWGRWGVTGWIWLGSNLHTASVLEPYSWLWGGNSDCCIFGLQFAEWLERTCVTQQILGRA